METFKFTKETIKHIIIILCIAASIIIFYALKLHRYFTYDNVEQVRSFILKMSFWGPLFIIFLFIVLNLIGMPNVFFVFLSGYLYGLLWGIVLGHIGTILGFTVSFVFIRYFFRDAFVRRYGKKKLIVWLENNTMRYKGWSVLFLRIIFAIPYSAQNVAYALTSISFKEYFFLSVIGSVPQTVVFALLGYLLSSRQIDGARLKFLLLIIVIVITVFASVYFTYILIDSKKDKYKKISS